MSAVPLRLGQVGRRANRRINKLAVVAVQSGDGERMLTRLGFV